MQVDTPTSTFWRPSTAIPWSWGTTEFGTMWGIILYIGLYRLVTQLFRPFEKEARVLALELLFESDPPLVLFLPAPLGGRGRTVSFPRFLLPLECEATWELNSFFCFSIFSGVCLSMRESLTHSSQFLFQPEKTSLIQVLD